LTDEAAKGFRNALRERFPIDVRRCPLYQDMKEGVTPGGIEYYLPLFFPAKSPHMDGRGVAEDPLTGTATLFDYLAGDALFVLGEGAGEASEAFWTQTAERYDQRAHDIERPVLPPAELYLSPELPLNRKGEEPGTSLRHFLESYPGRVLVAADSAGRREALLEMLAGAGLKPAPVASWQDFLANSPVGAASAATSSEKQRIAAEAAPTTAKAARFAITIAPLEQGFALTRPALTVLTERELFGERVRSERRRRRGAARDPDAIIRDLT